MTRQDTGGFIFLPLTLSGANSNITFCPLFLSLQRQLCCGGVPGVQIELMASGPAVTRLVSHALDPHALCPASSYPSIKGTAGWHSAQGCSYPLVEGLGGILPARVSVSPPAPCSHQPHVSSAGLCSPLGERQPQSPGQSA